jgi:two-component system, sensor histidine kinase and response regulator
MHESGNATTHTTSLRTLYILPILWLVAAAAGSIYFVSKIDSPDYRSLLIVMVAEVLLSLASILVIRKSVSRSREAFEENARDTSAQASEYVVLRCITDTLPDRIYVKDTQCRFRMNNRAHMTALNVSSQRDCLGKSDFDFRPHDIAQKSFDDDQTVLRTGLPIINREEATILPNGDRHWLLTTKVPLVERGQITGILGISRDITDHKHSMDKLSQERILLRTVIENVPDPIYVKDLEFRKILANLADLQYIGAQSAEEVLGKDDFDIFPKEVAEEFFKDDRTVIELGQPVINREEYQIGRNGQSRWLLTSKVPLRDEEGKIIGLVGIGHDITERKEAQARLQQQAELLRAQAQELIAARETALEASRLKSQFVANMSHEIRTPLNGIIGMTSMLLSTELSTEQNEFTEIIRQSGDALLTVINDILDFSKIEAGKLIIEDQDFDLVAVVEGAIEILAPKAQEKGLEVGCLIEGEVVHALRGDAGRIRQILVNLIGNAIKFTEKGEVMVLVSVEDESDRDVKVRIAVLDTGIGISREGLKKLFRPFSQEDGSTTRRYGGTGLGLAISKRLVELMGGEIGAESEQGKGSTFWWSSTFEKQSGNHIVRVPRKNLAGLRCLIVDDNETNRKIVHHYVISWGLANGSAEDGNHALAQLREAASNGHSYDLAILDMQMPEMDGIELAARIKADPSIASTRLILLTSICHRPLPKLQESGFNATLTKPVRQSQLFDCIAEVMSDSLDTSAPNGPPPRRPVKTASSPQLQLTDLRQHLKILVVEDNAVNQKVAVRMLAKSGFRADVAGNGIEALKAISLVPYDIVFMDCQMPEMDGFEATSQIRRLDGPDKHRVIIAMTANALQGDREKCLAAGMDDYISKPIRLTDLESAIARAGIPDAPKGPLPDLLRFS